MELVDFGRGFEETDAKREGLWLKIVLPLIVNHSSRCDTPQSCILAALV